MLEKPEYMRFFAEYPLTNSLFGKKVSKPYETKSDRGAFPPIDKTFLAFFDFTPE